MNKKLIEIPPTKLKYKLRISKSIANHGITDRLLRTEMPSPSSNKTMNKITSRTSRYPIYSRKLKVDPLDDFDEIIKTPYDNEL